MWIDTNSQESPLKQILGLMQTFTRASYKTWVWIICNMLSSLVIKPRTCDLYHYLEIWTVPLLTFMYTKSYPVYKYIHGLKTNILEQIIHVSASLWLVQQTDKGADRSSWGVFLTRCEMSWGTAVNVPHFYQNIVVKSILCFTSFISKNIQIPMIPLIRNM